jgi:hypothetical protein
MLKESDVYGLLKGLKAFSRGGKKHMKAAAKPKLAPKPALKKTSGVVDKLLRAGKGFVKDVSGQRVRKFDAAVGKGVGADAAQGVQAASARATAQGRAAMADRYGFSGVAKHFRGKAGETTEALDRFKTVPQAQREKLVKAREALLKRQRKARLMAGGGLAAGAALAPGGRPRPADNQAVNYRSEF